MEFPLNAAFVAQHIEPNRGKTVQVHYEIFRAASNTTSYSNVLDFVIGESVRPKLLTLDLIKECSSGKEIKEGETTHETSVVISGKSPKGTVLVVDSEISKLVGLGHPDSATGEWEALVIDLKPGLHSFQAAVANAPELGTTPKRTLTVSTVIAPG
ncbi:hypothetical protein LJU32_19740 [Pseudomonas sp. B21_DOA]|nr:hypothetical protein LJU32_19740 [Pseudomonas sp. B21_DOA]